MNRRMMLLIGGGVLAVILLVVIIYLSTRGRESTEVEEETGKSGDALKSGDTLLLKSKGMTLGVCSFSEGAGQGSCTNATGKDFNVAAKEDPPLETSTWTVHRVAKDPSGKWANSPHGTQINTGDNVTLTLPHEKDVTGLEHCGDYLRTKKYEGTSPADEFIFRIDQQGNDRSREVKRGDMVLLIQGNRHVAASGSVTGVCEGWTQGILDTSSTHWEII